MPSPSNEQGAARRGERARRVERTLLIDADDTLWENNVFYLCCTQRFIEFMASLGYAAEQVQATLDVCECEVVPTMGYGPEGYVTALGLACERLLQASGREPEAELIEQAREFGRPVLTPPMVLIADVRHTLLALRPSSQLVLVTKGNECGQRDKLARSGLEPLFDAVYVVPEKDHRLYQRIANELGLQPGHTWMVGNSPKSDINPAIRAGLGAVFVPHDRTWTAEHEELERPEQVVTLRRFADLLPFFGIESDGLDAEHHTLS